MTSHENQEKDAAASSKIYQSQQLIKFVKARFTRKYFSGPFSDIWFSIVDLIYSGFFSSYETIWSVSLFQTEGM